MRLDVLDQIAEGRWVIAGDTATYASWEVWISSFDEIELGRTTLVLTRTSGWYEQKGDATWDDVVVLARAMEAAEKALDAALEAARLAREVVRE